MQQHFKVLFFCKYWPDDGFLRPKLVANSRKTIKHYIVVSDGVHIQSILLITKIVIQGDADSSK